MAELNPGSELVSYRAKAPLRVKQLRADEREELLDLARKRAPDPSIFDEEGLDPFFFTLRASNTKVDSYFTKMDESSLTNYAADAADPGVQFQVSHNGGGGLFSGKGEVGFGRSLNGMVSGPKSDRACLIDFYTVPGLSCGNMTSDQFIKGARSGVYSDVSIGFTPDTMICNICGGDFLNRAGLSWDDPERCLHWPGVTYEIERGKKKVREVCILTVMNARLNEVSVVYDGATPDAGIVAVDMARMASVDGHLSENDRQLLENLYRVRIAPPQRLHAVNGVPIVSGKNTNENENENPAVVEVNGDRINDVNSDTIEAMVKLVPSRSKPVENADDPLAALREKYAEHGITIGTDPIRTIEVLADALLSQHSRIETLEQEAEDGRDIRQSLLSELDAEVVRARGSENAEANQKRYRAMVENRPLSEVRELIDDLKGDAEKRFKGGRLTVDVPENDDSETPADQARENRRSSSKPLF